MLSSVISTRSMTRLLTQTVYVATDQTLRVSTRLSLVCWRNVPEQIRARLLDTLLGPEDPTEYVSVTSTPMHS